MQRRDFIKETSLVAIGISGFGNIIWSQDHFTTDSPTTTDILGPYYRPGAPFRISINPKDYSGQVFHISGTVFKEDGKTPFQNCLLEIWQCDENKKYDNVSDEFRYRGSQRTKEDGKFHFIGMHPVPYPSEGNPDIWRPAHFHLLVSGEEQQDLITQIYLEKDPYLEKDRASASPEASKRILKIHRNKKNEEAVHFDIVMAKEFKPAKNVFEKIAGIYKMNDRSMMEFYKKGDLLFLKWNSQIREGLSYKGNNSFAGGINNLTTATFLFQRNNKVTVKVHFKSINRGEFDLEGIKTFKY